MTTAVEPQAADPRIRKAKPSLRMVLVNGHWYVPESECRCYEAHLRGEVPAFQAIGDDDPLIPLSQAARRVGVTAKTLMRRFPPPIHEAAKHSEDAQRIIKRMAGARQAAKAALVRADKPEMAANAA